VKLVVDTLNKRMVEPRRQCLPLAPKDLHKKARGGVVYVTVLGARNISSSKQTKQQPSYEIEGSGSNLDSFLEIEVGEVTRKTDAKSGPCPEWNSTFHFILHDNAGVLNFHLYKCTPGSVKYDLLASCEIKMRYVPDDSTLFWGVGADLSVVAAQAEACGKEIKMTVPFEGLDNGELSVKLVVKEWQFSDGSHSSFIPTTPSHNNASPNASKTGRRIVVTVVEAKNLPAKDNNKLGKSNPYVKLQYGKALHKTKPVTYSTNPTWNQKFEFDEEGNGEYLKIKCYTEETFSDDMIGSARVNLEGLTEGNARDVSVPLEKAASGELRLLIEAHNSEGCPSVLKLVLVEARDLVAADLRGSSDPYVVVQYGNLKRTTKMISRTLNPKWDQVMEFAEDGSALALHVKDHNTLLPETNLGNCSIDYQTLPPNQTWDRWIPLQGVKRGEIRLRITRAVQKPVLDCPSQSSPAKIKEMLMKLRSEIDDNDTDKLSKTVSELEILQNSQDEYVAQLQTEQKLMIDKINELGQEIF
ncbi:hypothetical protein M569_14258, partial [Genlisea aurea]